MPPTTHCLQSLVRPPSQWETRAEMPMPPSCPWPSTSSTVNPARRAASAAATPAGPPPHTTTS